MTFDRIKGYGFVAPEGGGEDVFLHVNDLIEGDKSQLDRGSVVKFRIEEGERGPKASDAILIEAARRNGADVDGEELCDVLTAAEFGREVTEVLLRAAPPLTGEQILDVRTRLLAFAQSHGWTDR